MKKHRAIICGAGRIGAGYNWHDDAYTHAGAYRALSDRVELVGFVEPDLERRVAANLKWKVPTFDSVEAGLALKPDIVSVCVQPTDQFSVLKQLHDIKGIWCEKPYVSPKPDGKVPIQVSYMRRADPMHQWIADNRHGGDLTVYGKDDIHTRCHFEDLAKWWRAKLIYKPVNGPCSYIYDWCSGHHYFENGGVDGGKCFKLMLENLLDHIDKGIALWSPAT